MKKLLLLLFVLVTMCSVFAEGNWQIIKARGDYGIANKGINQGVRVGQQLELQRELTSGMINIGSVKVIRVTANRAAIEKVDLNAGFQLQVGDQLVLPAENPLTIPEPVVSQQPLRSHESEIAPVTKEPQLVRETDVPDVEEYKKTFEKTTEHKPWISVNTGATVPGSGFASGYSTSPVFGAAYMVPVKTGIYIGLEINQSFINNSSNAANLGSSNELSSSLLEGLIVGQKFFGQYFFMEAGGGLYRPKVTIAAVDGVKSSFASTDFGLFGGTGVFVPTSNNAGFSLRARVHNYFDQSSRTYFGLSGGFRFRME